MNKNSLLYQELPEETIALLVKETLQEEMTEAFLLDGGLFNTTYKVTFASGQAVVLRLGPVNRHLLMPFEENLMEAERYIYEACEKKGIPCSHVRVCDTTKTRIPRDYMMVDYIESKPLSDESIPETAKALLFRQVGTCAAQLHSITHGFFGRVSLLLSGERHDTWHGYLLSEVEHLAKVAAPAGIFTADEIVRIKRQIILRKHVWDKVVTPRLVHADLWSGNVLVRQEGDSYTVAAIIDVDRAVFGDRDFELASQWLINDDFIAGYGAEFDADSFGKGERADKCKLYRMLYALLDAYVWVVQYQNEQASVENQEIVRNLLAELEQA